MEPEPREGLLHDIFRFLAITEHPGGEAEQSSEIPFDQNVAGDPVAAGDPAEQLLIRRLHPAPDSLPEPSGSPSPSATARTRRTPPLELIPRHLPVPVGIGALELPSGHGTPHGLVEHGELALIQRPAPVGIGLPKGGIAHGGALLRCPEARMCNSPPRKQQQSSAEHRRGPACAHDDHLLCRLKRACPKDPSRAPWQRTRVHANGRAMPGVICAWWLTILFLLPGSGRATTPDAEAIGEAAGVGAEVADGGVVRLAWSREDLAVVLDGLPLPPAAGLMSVATITPGRSAALMLAEIVLEEHEVSPTLDVALARSLAVGGLECRMPWARPPVMVLYLQGEGEPLGLAAALRAVREATSSARQGRGGSDEHARVRKPPASGPDATALENALGVPVRLVNGVAHVVIGRDTMLRRTRLGSAQEVGTRLWVAGDAEHATIVGQIATAPAEVQTVVRALRAGGLHLTSLGGRLVGESPPMLLVGFRGAGPAVKLATAVRATLEAQRAVRR